MHSFTDSKGHEWNIELNLAAAERIDSCDFSLLTDKKICFLNPDESFFHLLATNTSVLFACIWCTILPQASEKGIDQDLWKDGMTGPVISSGKEAFWSELQDFFPEMRTVLLKLRQTQERLHQKFEERMERISKDMDGKMDQRMDRELDSMEKEMMKEI